MVAPGEQTMATHRVRYGALAALTGGTRARDDRAYAEEVDESLPIAEALKRATQMKTRGPRPFEQARIYGIRSKVGHGWADDRFHRYPDRKADGTLK